MRQVAGCLRDEIDKLIEAGCRHIQIDEPCLMRRPDIAETDGIRIAAQIVAGLHPQVETTIHLCCGYPDCLVSQSRSCLDSATAEGLLHSSFRTKMAT